MTRDIAEVAKQAGTIPGHVLAVLDEFGLAHEGTHFEADDDVIGLVLDSLAERAGSKTVHLAPGRTPRDLAFALGLPPTEVQLALVSKLKVMASITTVLKPDVAERLAENFGYALVWAQQGTKPKPPVVAAPKPQAPKGVQPRPPVVTILGHVDHGKTSLLDYIRKSNVAAKEHGGITQHIGAYQVELPEGAITFLDTPGHAAFTAMRARGAQVTDIAILVVAADDGIMPQTVEAIGHAKSAGVPVIVAVNKIDKADANPDRVLRQLTEHELIPEAYGGQTITCNVSALTGEGVQALLELILLQAGLMQLTADPKGALRGVVIEAKLDKGRGPVATILVQDGTLKTGDAIVVGTTYGRVRGMIDHRGERLQAAGPATPAEVLGLSDVPQAGDGIEYYREEREARLVADERAAQARLRSLAPTVKRRTLRDLRASLERGESKDLNLLVKADVQGSVEAVRGLIEKIENEEVTVKVIYAGVGPITESDILLASAADAICVGFNVRTEAGAKKEAERAKVEIRTYSIIYELIEEIEAAVRGMLAPKFEEEFLGRVEIRVVFDLSRAGKVAGSHVTEGKVQRGALCRVRRGNEVVWEGKIASLKNVKQDVREMIAGQDCGIQFEGWQDFAEGDVIEAFALVQVN
jgi:translation initiation factor IF-2